MNTIKMNDDVLLRLERERTWGGFFVIYVFGKYLTFHWMNVQTIEKEKKSRL